jgi:hypothetical protein
MVQWSHESLSPPINETNALIIYSYSPHWLKQQHISFRFSYWSTELLFGVGGFSSHPTYSEMSVQNQHCHKASMSWVTNIVLFLSVHNRGLHICVISYVIFPSDCKFQPLNALVNFFCFEAFSILRHVRLITNSSISGMLFRLAGIMIGFILMFGIL